MNIFLLIFSIIFVSCTQVSNSQNEIRFRNASVHDPSIINVDEGYYIIGSHLAFASSKDLVNWKQLAVSVRKKNVLFPEPFESLKEVFDYAQTRTMWAGDIIKLKDGKYHYYFSACKGDRPLSALGVATSNKVDGPYENIKIILKSGSNQSTYPKYNATVDPNVVDPAVFYDKEGKLWMVYGSYSGGIFILEMDENTGLPKEGQKWGKKLLGGNHSRIEAPYIIYNKETGYYYLFLSYGGLDSTGGYNIRVARSKTPDGPYFDSEGNNMLDSKGKKGSFFDDNTISKYGTKLLGSFTWDKKNERSKTGYVSPGHNSNYYDKATGKYFIIFHTRFPNKGERHEVRVHEMKFNSDGWPVVLPFRYTGLESENIKAINGKFKLVFHGRDVSAEIKTPVEVDFKKNGSLRGKGIKGTWEINEGNKIELIIDGKTYLGFIEKQWNEYENKSTKTLSVLSNNNESIWGYQ